MCETAAEIHSVHSRVQSCDCVGGFSMKKRASCVAFLDIWHRAFKGCCVAEQENWVLSGIDICVNEITRRYSDVTLNRLCHCLGSKRTRRSHRVRHVRVTELLTGPLAGIYHSVPRSGLRMEHIPPTPVLLALPEASLCTNPAFRTYVYVRTRQRFHIYLS